MNKLINFKKYKIIRLEFLLILQQFWPQNFPQVPAEKRQYLQAMHNDLFEQVIYVCVHFGGFPKVKFFFKFFF